MDSKLKEKILFIVKVLISLPKTIIFNFMHLPLNQAIKLPILIGFNTKVHISKNASIKINHHLSPFMVKYNIGEGSEGVEIGRNGHGLLKLSAGSKLIFNGKALFQKGVSIRCEGGNLEIGSNVQVNKHSFISCSSEIIIGDDALFGWNVEIRDSDGHSLVDLNLENSGTVIENESTFVHIGDHVWLAGNVKIMKNVIVPRNSVVAYNSCVIKPFYEENVLIAGYPAKVKKENIDWVM